MPNRSRDIGREKQSLFSSIILLSRLHYSRSSLVRQQRHPSLHTWFSSIDDQMVPSSPSVSFLPGCHLRQPPPSPLEGLEFFQVPRPMSVIFPSPMTYACNVATYWRFFEVDRSRLGCSNKRIFKRNSLIIIMRVGKNDKRESWLKLAQLEGGEPFSERDYNE